MKVAAFLRGLPAVPAGAGRLLPTRLCTAGQANSGVYLLRGNFALWPWETSPGRVSQQEPQAGEEAVVLQTLESDE